MNTRPTEIRTPSALQAQARLERMLAARRAADAAREARLRRLPTPRNPGQPTKPEPFTWVDSFVFLLLMTIVAVLILIARWSGWLQ